jgi:hypothetical protein
VRVDVRLARRPILIIFLLIRCMGATEEPACSAENRSRGIVARITAGRINAKYAVHLSDGTDGTDGTE